MSWVVSVPNLLPLWPLKFRLMSENKNPDCNSKESISKTCQRTKKKTGTEIYVTSVVPKMDGEKFCSFV